MSLLVRIAASVALISAIVPSLATNDVDQTWHFKVFLDDREIGEHIFELVENDDSLELRTRANFQVRFLFFKAYRYEHMNTERWQGDCLQEIDAETEINGDLQLVYGLRRHDGFVVSTAKESRTLPSCIMTFAYWNPRFLQESRLLNAQTGEYLQVDVVASADPKTIEVNGEPIAAKHYRVRADELDIALWYSAEEERWLALESTLESGRTLRYEPI